MKLVYVNRFKWSHDKKRKKLRKLAKQGKAKVVRRDRDGWLYEVM